MKKFQILSYHDRRYKYVESVPWEFVAPHAEQARSNHGQTLERLNERGGLCPAELWHVIHGKRWNGPLLHGSHISTEDAVKWINAKFPPS